MEKQITRVAIEYWQLYKIAESMLHEIPVDSARQKGSRISYLFRQFQRFLAEHDLQLVDFTHQVYEANLPVLVMNKDEVDINQKLVIARTYEPTVIKKGIVYEMGKVFLEPAQ